MEYCTFISFLPGRYYRNNFSKFASTQRGGGQNMFSFMKHRMNIQLVLYNNIKIKNRNRVTNISCILFSFRNFYKAKERRKLLKVLQNTIKPFSKGILYICSYLPINYKFETVIFVYTYKHF